SEPRFRRTAGLLSTPNSETNKRPCCSTLRGSFPRLIACLILRPGVLLLPEPVCGCLRVKPYACPDAERRNTPCLCLLEDGDTVKRTAPEQAHRLSRRGQSVRSGRPKKRCFERSAH